jgi:hypothetical protein
MFTEDFNTNESADEDLADAKNTASKLFEDSLPGNISKQFDKQTPNEVPPEVGSLRPPMDSAARATEALDTLADKVPGLSKIERTALKDLQRAVLSGDYSKISNLVKDFEENPKAFTNIAAALKKNLEANGVTVSYDVVEPKPDGRSFPPYGVLTFGLKSGQTEATLKMRTNDLATGSELSKSLASALSKMVIEQYDIKKLINSSGLPGDVGIGPLPQIKRK